MDITRIEDSILNSYAKAESYLRQSFEIPTWDFNLRGRVAGMAFLYKNHISLNKGLFENNKEEFLNQTIPHECAHLIAYNYYGEAGAGHGRLWKDIMVVLGVEPVRCHDYDITTVSKVVPASCSCGAIDYLGQTKAKRLKSGAVYRCCRCKSKIVLT